jgi:C1A family cysteine protease
MKKLFIILCLVVLAITTVTPVSVVKAATPLKPALVEFSVTAIDGPEESSSFGKIDGYNPVQDQYYIPENPSLKSVTATAPSFDLSASGDYTSLYVKNQGSIGSCWAFAAVASAESSLVKSKIDLTNTFLSERHLIWSVYNTNAFAYNSTTTNHNIPFGGNRNDATAAFAKGYGPQLESVFPYSGIEASYSSYNSSFVADPLKNNFGSIKTSAFQLKSSKWLPEIRTKTSHTYNENAVDAIKTTLRAGNYVDISYFVDETGPANGTYNGNYNPTTHNWYNSSYNYANSSNHSVTIVGYDDSRSFSGSITGGFKIRNSWGTAAFGDNGYFWMPYKEPSFNEPTVFELQKNSSTATVTQGYVEQGYGFSSSMIYTNDAAKTISYASIFSAPGAKTGSSFYLKQFSFYAAEAGQTDSFAFYNLGSTTNPTDGIRLAKGISIKSTYAGYYNVTLATPLRITPGSKYSIVDKVTASSSKAQIPLEYRFTNSTPGGINYKASKWAVSAGQSFVKFSTNGTLKNWTDVTKINSIYKKAGISATVGNTLITAYVGYQKAIKPYTPSVSKVTVAKKKMTVTIGKAVGNVKYEIWYSLKKTKKFKKVEVDYTAQTNVIKKLKRGKPYYVKIRGYYKIGSKIYYSDYSNTKKTKKIK